MPILRTITACAIGALVALAGASVLPWIPALRTIAPVSAFLTVLVVMPTRTWAFPIMAIATAAGWYAALRGDAVLPITVCALGAWVFLRAPRRTLRQRNATIIALAVTAAVSVLAERVVAPIIAGTFPPFAWMPVVLTGAALAVAWNIAIGTLLLRIVPPARTA